jgi:hypothetical protein
MSKSEVFETRAPALAGIAAFGRERLRLAGGLAHFTFAHSDSNRPTSHLVQTD